MGDRLAVLGPAPFIPHGPDVRGVVGLHGRCPRRHEVVLGGEARSGTLDQRESDVLEEEGAAQEVVLIGEHVEGLAALIRPAASAASVKSGGC